MFVSRNKDYTNSPENKAFGPVGFQCPGNKYTFKFIHSILTFLQKYNITIEGTPVYKGKRFEYIANKNEIIIQFDPKVRSDFF